MDRGVLTLEMKSLRESVVGSNALDGKFIEWPRTHPGDGPLHYSAYNQSRNESLCAHVELVDVPPADLREYLETLTPGSKRAIWLVPFRGISADQVSFSIDLVFLDRNNCVMALTESFPIVHANTCNWPAGSALALPAQTIANCEILAGDQLILCSPEKLQRRLRNLQGSEDHLPDLGIHSHSLSYVPSVAQAETQVSMQVIQWEETAGKKPAEMTEHVDAAPPQLDQPESKPAETAQARTRKGWLPRWLWPRSKELRRSPRESLPWLAAYFSEEGAPVPSTVRDISADGMYVPTGERREPGTIVRATLADWRQPSPERSIAVNATVARCDDGGIGFRFIFDKEKKQQYGAMPSIMDWSLANVTRKEVKEFLRQFRGRK